jgi:hypothetical protein
MTTNPRITPGAHTLSRRALLLAGASAGASLALGSQALAAGATEPVRTVDSSALTPGPAITGVLAAMDARPLVGLGEYHYIQDFHDFLTALLHHPELPDKINDIAVEFGNATYQPLIDRFILDRAPIPRHDLVQVWRQIGDVGWNAPVYEQFFRTVRAVNWMLPARQRIRVLLGQPPVTMQQLLAHPHDHAAITEFEDYVDRHIASVIERDVLARGRRALMIAGDGHMLKGLHAPDDGTRPNVATGLEARHPGSVYSIDLLLIPPAPTDPALAELLSTAQSWPVPSLLPLAGTALGALTKPLDSTGWVNTLGYRAIHAADRRYDRQADAVLWLGPGNTITSSQPDPAIYHWGPYPTELDRLDPILSANPELVPTGLQIATAPPNWFAQFHHPPKPGPKAKKHKRH